MIKQQPYGERNEHAFYRTAQNILLRYLSTNYIIGTLKTIGNNWKQIGTRNYV